jgi:RimJ/RimL family protein N-acetyltransferase
MPSLETARTYLRPFQPSDVQIAHEWLGDPEVMRHIPGGSLTLDQTAERVSRYIAHEIRRGFSKWLIYETASNMPIGDSGFFTLPDRARVELGYRLRKSHWGKGLATEVSRAWLSVAHDWYGLTEVYAYALPGNTASLHVMQKLGFAYSHLEDIYEVEVPLYKLQLGGQ